MPTAPKREQVTNGIRAAIVHGEYEDGLTLNQSKLATRYSVHRQVVWQALADLEREGYVSADERHRFHVNATYASRQLQLTRNQLERVERYVGQIIVMLGGAPTARPTPADGLPQPPSGSYGAANHTRRFKAA